MYLTQTEQRLIATRKALRRAQAQLAEARQCRVDMPQRVKVCEQQVFIWLNRLHFAQEAVQCLDADQRAKRDEFRAMLFSVPEGA